MRCSYCGVEIVDYPASGICAHCGGKLPERPAGTRCEVCGTYSSGNFCTSCGRSLHGAAPVPPAQAPVQPVYVSSQPRILKAGINCCPKCRSTQLLQKPRGFSWGLAILGFFLIPVFGLLLGFCGRKKVRMTCLSCGHNWKPY